MRRLIVDCKLGVSFSFRLLLICCGRHFQTILQLTKSDASGDLESRTTQILLLLLHKHYECWVDMCWISRKG